MTELELLRQDTIEMLLHAGYAVEEFTYDKEEFLLWFSAKEKPKFARPPRCALTVRPCGDRLQYGLQWKKDSDDDVFVAMMELRAWALLQQF